MNERRDDLSTADLAAQQPTDTAPPDRTEAGDLERRDVTADDPGREELQPDLSPDATIPQDRAADVEPGRDPLRQDQDRSAEVGVDQESVSMPVGAPAAQAAPDTGTADSTSTAGPLLANDDAEGFRARWTDVQTGFVDAPREAVERADGLVAELMQHLAKTFADERGRLESQWDRGDDVPTDDLRTAFQRYRSFFERLLAT
jgi:hypothetical protein